MANFLSKWKCGEINTALQHLYTFAVYFRKMRNKKIPHLLQVKDGGLIK
jgi:hypothetical protein